MQGIYWEKVSLSKVVILIKVANFFGVVGVFWRGLPVINLHTIGARSLLITGFVGGGIGAFVGKEIKEEVGIAIFILGCLMFILGCFWYAKEKGYSRLWGILGFLWVTGLLVLWLFPDRTTMEGQEKWKIWKYYAQKFVGMLMLFTVITNFPDDVENKLPRMSTGEQVWFVFVSIIWITVSTWLILRKRKIVIEVDNQ